jgi:DNA-binding CsgD family transcriptional regulator
MNGKGIHKLTPREREVLGALASGLSTKEVAAELGLTIETVRSYTKTIYATLDVHNRAEAAMAAVEAGLLEIPGARADEEPSRREAMAPPIRPVIGRDKELGILAERLAEHRLVSIVGIGGAGKTVLAREAARAHIARTNDDGAFVMLEHVDDDVGLAMAVAEALGIHLQRAGADAWREVARLAENEPCLLVLDNVEHLVDHADLGMRQAVISMLAGDVYANRDLGWRLALFRVCYGVFWLLEFRRSLSLDGRRTRLASISVPENEVADQP